ncbi:1676_t:CDS:1 [Funneliformis caledonium]|uniref:Guanine deaminase n=1 Tax=Funneliformis caledonium TaxID=1117310 RepID=A0A9N9B8Y6_9GLOM|nr:1676_t:CDS:1 [Funneliformis caledonium]
MSTKISKVFYGTLIHSLSLKSLEILQNTLLGIDCFGKIAFIEKDVLEEKILNEIIVQWKFPEEEVIRLSKWQFLMPGFIDTHTHAPQYPNAGTGMDLPLLDWLKRYTFPLERSYSSLSFAKKMYPTVVSRLLRNGTTTAVYFATTHLESSKYLAKLVKQNGQRGFVGKVNMDCNSPKDYVETLDDSVKSTEEFINYVLNLEEEKGESKLVYPIITPRFAITCTSQLMSSIGSLAKKYDIPIQSHLSENLDEIEFISELFPNLPDYTTVYDHHGLLNGKTIMAHGIHLSSKERKLIKERDVGISHCPNSNFAICSGLCNVRQLLNEGIKVGLGTDLSAGYSKSILNAVRNASIASRVIFMSHSSNDNDKSFPHLTLPELTYLATMGGAELVNLDKKIGNFLIGKEFDALLVDPNCNKSPLDIFDDFDDFERIFEKFMFLGDERNLKSIYVKGKKVSGTDFEEVNLHDKELLENLGELNGEICSVCKK